MGTRDPRIDAYIEKQQAFAKPILTHLRDVVHATCPEAHETLKWSSPHFDFGRLTSVKDLPSRTVLKSLIKQAMRLNDEGISVTRPKKAPKPEATMPSALTAALGQNRRAAGQFEQFSPSRRREYSEWIDDAKRDDTRAKRIAQAIEWIADGIGRNWKYEK